MCVRMLLAGRADFVGVGDEPAFHMARWNRRERDHVCADAVGHHVVDGEIGARIAFGRDRVPEPMPAVCAVVILVPVVQEIVVEQGGAHQ